jgi:hypothetical protein
LGLPKEGRSKEEEKRFLDKVVGKVGGVVGTL